MVVSAAAVLISVSRVLALRIRSPRISRAVAQLQPASWLSTMAHRMDQQARAEEERSAAAAQGGPAEEKEEPAPSPVGAGDQYEFTGASHALFQSETRCTFGP